MIRSDVRYSPGRIAVDLVVACGAIAIFGALSYALYLPLQQGTQPQNVVVRSIANGETHALLISNGTCVGEVLTKLTTDDSPSLDTSLTIRSRFNGEEAVTTARFSAHFNPLHQLGRGSAAIESKLFSASVTATDVTPIRITASGRLGNSIRSIELTIPGPVSLVKNDGSSHRLEYANLPASLSGQTTRSFLSSVADELAIVVTPTTGEAAGCARIPSGSLDLTSLITKFGPFVRPLLEESRL